MKSIHKIFLISLQFLQCIISNQNKFDISDDYTKIWSPQKHIKSLDGIQIFNNTLTVLNFYINEISTIEQLTSLTKLIDLYLGSNQINDISPLKGLINLKILDLSNIFNMSHLNYYLKYLNLLIAMLNFNCLLGPFKFT